MRTSGCEMVDRVIRRDELHRRRKVEKVSHRVEKRDDGHHLIVTYAAGGEIAEHLPRRSERRGARLRARVRRAHRLRVLFHRVVAGDRRAHGQLRAGDSPEAQQRHRFHAAVSEHLAANIQRDASTAQSVLYQRIEPPPPPCDVHILLNSPRPGPAARVAFRVA